MPGSADNCQRSNPRTNGDGSDPSRAPPRRRGPRRRATSVSPIGNDLRHGHRGASRRSEDAEADEGRCRDLVERHGTHVFASHGQRRHQQKVAHPDFPVGFESATHSPVRQAWPQVGVLTAPSPDITRARSPCPRAASAPVVRSTSSAGFSDRRPKAALSSSQTLSRSMFDASTASRRADARTLTLDSHATARPRRTESWGKARRYGATRSL